jgi:hypothetical protein
VTRPGPKKNLPASVRDRLMQLARARKEDFNFVLTRYAMERLLYRLSRSTHEPTFILKGAMLFTVWSGHPHRATKDIDLLGTGEPDLGRLVKVFQDICTVSVEDDGIIFDSTSVTAVRIKEDANYEGVRVQLKGTRRLSNLGRALGSNPEEARKVCGSGVRRAAHVHPHRDFGEAALPDRGLGHHRQDAGVRKWSG